VVSLAKLRGKAVPALKEPEAGEQPAVDSPEPTAGAALDDRGLLQQFDPQHIAGDPQRRGVVINQGATISNPQERHREYRGLLRIARRGVANGHQFQGVTQWGPAGLVGSQEKIVYSGDDLEAASRAVNKMINKKLSKDYQITDPNDHPLVSADHGRKVAQQMIKSQP
jgi:hypothetical protein